MASPHAPHTGSPTKITGLVGLLKPPLGGLTKPNQSQLGASTYSQSLSSNLLHDGLDIE